MTTSAQRRVGICAAAIEGGAVPARAAHGGARRAQAWLDTSSPRACTGQADPGTSLPTAIHLPRASAKGGTRRQAPFRAKASADIADCLQACRWRRRVPGDPLVPTQAKKTLPELLDIMAALRTPVTGCPWDLVQTFETIAPYTIEEAYEVADAIARRDMAGLRDELGDLLLQVVYHARMAEEQGAFAFADVVGAIAAKILRRHPHVLGSEAERAAGAAHGFRERIQGEEKAQTPEPATGVLDNVPVALPALTRAVKLQMKAASVGFDWPSLKEVFDKLKEELSELEAALTPSPASAARPADQQAITEELGDLLFVIANLARHLKVEPETVLRHANAKFERRFAGIERKLARLGKTPRQSDLAEMDRLWDEVKAEEGKA